jgi:hypothetical protein
VDGTCGMHRRGEESIQGFVGKAQRDYSEDRGIDGIWLAQDRGRWWAFLYIQ